MYRQILSRTISTLIILILFSLAMSASANLAPEVFAKTGDYVSVKLSPDGKYFAVVMLVEGKRKLAVFDSKTIDHVGFFSFKGDDEVGNIQWVNNERIVMSVYQRTWREKATKDYGELYAVNFDGSAGRMIYGYRAGALLTGSNRATYGWGKIIDYLPHDDKHILISSETMSDDRDNLAKVYKLNVYNGKMRVPLTRSPIPGASFITDQHSNLRLVYGLDEERKLHFYQFDNEERSWTELPTEMFGNNFQALRFDESGDNLYVLDNFQQDKVGLFKLSMKTGKRKHLYTNENVDITSAIFSSDQNSVYALRIDDGYPAYVVFNSASDEAKTFKTLVSSFPGSKMYITSQTNDGNKSILYIASDTSPGAFYLFDKQNSKLSLLYNNLENIKSEQLSESTPIEFKASDGQMITGYFNPPVSKEAKSAPMITLVHGGPHGVRDYWEYDPEVHMLTNQGYSVLRVNYRGSDGYGRAFEEKGYHQWGNRIQLDIIEATQWTAKQYHIDDDRLCIMGTSFGAYSAMQSAILAPDLFKCVVANAGIYDLELMREDDIVGRIYWGGAYLDDAIGNDEQQLRAYSPVFNAEKLKAQLFIAHGEKDEIAPLEHAEKLAKALKKANKPYKWFIKEKEGHGFFNEQNREEYYEEVARFLGESLK